MQSTVTEKESCDNSQEKSDLLFTGKNNDTDSYSYGNQTDTVAVMIGSIFWIL